MRERWKPVPGWEGLYSVSTLGNVRSESRTKIRECLNRWGGWTRFETTTKPRLLRPNQDSGGYMQVVLQRPGERLTIGVHRLVLSAFRKKPAEHDHGMHRNDVRSDNKLSNLKWGTKLQNMQDMARKGRASIGNRAYPQLSHAQQRQIASRSNEPIAALALEFNTSSSNVSKIRAKAKKGTL